MTMAHSSYTFEDLSGSAASTSSNPYDGLIEACHHDPAQVQARYAAHRETREVQQKAKLLSREFTSVTTDQILHKLENEPGFEDPRHCLVYWARPPQKIKDLVSEIQSRIKTVVPRLWTMPPLNLHMTALEITHSKSEAEITTLVDQLRPVLEQVTDYTLTHRARLIRPMITYDAQALALSYLPAAGESLSTERAAKDDEYSYHQLRRDLYEIASQHVKVESRYVVPSAHLTIGRFIYADEFETEQGGFDHARMAKLVQVIEATNAWLREEYWPKEGQDIKAGGEWIVGEAKGLDHRRGALWYGGGGETVRLGKGF